MGRYRFLDGRHRLTDDEQARLEPDADGVARCPSCGKALKVVKPMSVPGTSAQDAQERAEARRDAARDDYKQRTRSAWRAGA
ncbi:MAG: hypothetical protein R3F35_01675 [Myxococcota bacterium]